MLFDGHRLVAIAGLCACSDDDGAGLRLRWTGHPWGHLGLMRGQVTLQGKADTTR